MVKTIFNNNIVTIAHGLNSGLFCLLFNSFGFGGNCSMMILDNNSS